MLFIKGQNAENFKHTDTLKNDCFPDTKIRFLIENPPFGTPWSGDNAKQGQEDAVKAEFAKDDSRWGAGTFSVSFQFVFKMLTIIYKSICLIFDALVAEHVEASKRLICCPVFIWSLRQVQ